MEKGKLSPGNSLRKQGSSFATALINRAQIHNILTFQLASVLFFLVPTSQKDCPQAAACQLSKLEHPTPAAYRAGLRHIAQPRRDKGCGRDHRLR
mmetsp:Transcript_41372/g.54389  ORF Transcript_41372/g.54389 Transcript_41372/m.54389 type:complete len:95 (-) Transcript_41372:566-850(-)